MSAWFGNGGGCSGLIAPAGGRLVDLRAVGAEREALEAEAPVLPVVPLDRRAALELTLLATGAYSPLDRFLGREERRRVTAERRLEDGSFFPAPVTLAAPTDGLPITAGGRVALTGGDGRLLAVMTVDEADRVAGRTYLAGRPRVLEVPIDPRWRRFHWNPRESRECLERYGRSRVVAFAGDRAISTEELAAVSPDDDLLLLHPPATLDEPWLDERLAPLEELARSRRGGACLAILPWPRGGEGDDLLVRALVHRNFGADHLLLSEDEPGLALLERHAEDLGVTPLVGEGVAA